MLWLLSPLSRAVRRPGGGKFIKGRLATLVATAQEHYKFLGFYEGDTLLSTEQTYVFTVRKDMDITARFALKQYQVSATVQAGRGGTVSGGGAYTALSSVTLVASPSAHWGFEGWYVNNVKVSQNSRYVFTVSSNISVEARFYMLSYTISTRVSLAGKGTVSGGGTYTALSTVTLKVSGVDAVTCEFVGWYEGDTRLSTSSTYTFTATKSMTIVARIRAKTLKSKKVTNGQIGVVNTYSFSYPNGIRPTKLEYTVWLSNGASYRDVVSQTVTGSFSGNVDGHVENPDSGAYIRDVTHYVSIVFDDTAKTIKMSWPNYVPKYNTNLYCTVYWYE